MARSGNGWRAGRDPVQRWLRIVSGIVFLTLFVVIALDPTRSMDDVPILGLALGALLILLGYESAIRLPGITRRGGDDDADT